MPMPPPTIHDEAPRASAPAFDPLDLASIATLSPKTIHALSWDLARARDLGRLRAMEPLIPFATAHGALDAALCAFVLHVADSSWADSLCFQLEARFLAGHRQLHHASNSLDDFGPLCAVLAMEALADRLAHPQSPLSEPARHGLGKAIRLARSPCLPISSPFHDSPSRLPCYGFLRLPQPAAGLVHAELLRLGLPPLSPTPCSVALALAASGEPDLLDALLSRPDAIDRLRAAALAEHPSGDDPRSEFKALQTHLFWTHAAPLALRLVDLARSPSPGRAPGLHHRVAAAIVQAARGDANHPALRQALGERGDDFFSALLNGLSIPTGALFDTSAELASADDFFKPACLLLMDKVFDMSTPIRNVDYHLRWRCLLSALFSPLPGVAELAQASWAAIHGAGSDPYAASLGFSGIPAHIDAICLCNRPEIATRALDSMGIQAAQGFPPHRKGLDASLTMLVAHKAPQPIFRAVIEWFASRGGLAEQASAKAWVYQGAETRKKGDLLADCVARGNLDQARLLLVLLPGADIKPAREVARAMAAKAPGGAGAIALSAWETLLLNKVLQAHRRRTPPLGAAAEAASRPRRL